MPAQAWEFTAARCARLLDFDLLVDFACPNQPRFGEEGVAESAVGISCVTVVVKYVSTPECGHVGIRCARETRGHHR